MAIPPDLTQWAQTGWLEVRSSIGRCTELPLEASDSSVLNKKKVKFGCDAHHLHGLLELVHVNVGILPRLHHLEAIGTLFLL